MLIIKYVDLFTHPEFDQMLTTIMKEPVTSVNLSFDYSFNGENNLVFKMARVQFGDKLTITDFSSQTNQLGILIFNQLTEEAKQTLYSEWKMLVLLAIGADCMTISHKFAKLQEKCDSMTGG